MAIRGARFDLVKIRLQVVLQQARQGVPLSQALQAVKGDRRPSYAWFHCVS
ncbi:hypothetical protein [Caulobacter sp. Root1472]|uniref:hypothetical protein n=1 Tax=Caulobacter sp. Root1472 TaxID=1736470 RepID=UPI00138F2A67|nr:hypothetical protein [Caulobacter sp. Root1472]